MDAGKTPTDPITVTAFSERFEHAFAELLGIEGGFVDDPVDRGGATKYGISLRFLKAEGAINAVLRAGQYRSIPLKVDGQIGEKARRAFDSMWARHPGQLAIEYREAVKDRYVAIVRRNPSQAKFLKGWLNRAERLGR